MLFLKYLCIIYILFHENQGLFSTRLGVGDIFIGDMVDYGQLCKAVILPEILFIFKAGPSVSDTP